MSICSIASAWRHTFASYRLFKWIKVDDNHVDRLNGVIAHCRLVVGIVANAKQGAVNLRMKSLYATVHHFRKARYIGDIAHFDARLAQRLGRATRADHLNAKVFEFACEVNDASLVRHADKRATDFCVNRVPGFQSCLESLKSSISES